jgi:hypothetical protein
MANPIADAVAALGATGDGGGDSSASIASPISVVNFGFSSLSGVAGESSASSAKLVMAVVVGFVGFAVMAGALRAGGVAGESATTAEPIVNEVGGLATDLWDAAFDVFEALLNPKALRLRTSEADDASFGGLLLLRLIPAFCSRAFTSAMLVRLLLLLGWALFGRIRIITRECIGVPPY